MEDLGGGLCAQLFSPPNSGTPRRPQTGFQGSHASTGLPLAKQNRPALWRNVTAAFGSVWWKSFKTKRHKLSKPAWHYNSAHKEIWKGKGYIW